MTSTQSMTKLVGAASVALCLALLPGLATAESAPAETGSRERPVLLAYAPTNLVLDVGEAAAQPARSYSASEVGSFALGPTIGFITGNSITQFRITGEAQYTITELSPRFYLDLAGHVGLFLGGVSGCPAGVSCSATTFEIVPAARFRYALDNKLSFYGDGGLGVAFFSSTVSVGPFSASVSETWGVFRIAGGIQYKVTPNVILLGEPVGLNVYFGTGSGFMYSLAGGVLFKI